MIKRIIILTIFVSMSTCFSQEARKIAFIPLKAESPGAKEWISDGIEFLFNNKISVISKLYSFDRKLIRNALNEINYKSGTLSNRAAGQLGRVLNTEITISGTYTNTNSGLLFNIYYHNATSGDQIFKEQIRATSNELINVSDKIITTVAEIASIQITENEKELMEQSLTKSSEAFESFIKAYQENEKPDSDYEKVIRLFKQAISLDKNFWEAYYDLGIAYFNNEQYNSAKKQFNTIINSLPNFDKPYFGRALILEKQEKYDSALVDLRIVSEINPNDYKAYFYMGKIYTALKSFDAAKENLDKSQKINPYFAPVFYAYGNLEVAKGNERDAIPYYRKATELQPENKYYRQTLGETYYRTRVYYNALVEFGNILEKDPDDPLANFMKGVTIYKQAVLEDLVDAFLDLLEEEGYQEWVEEVRSKKVESADPQRRLQALQEMAASFYKASRNKENFLQATFNLGLTYMEMDSLKQAEKFLNQTLDIDPQFITAYIKLAEVKRRQKNIPAAINQFRKAFYTDPVYFVKKPTLGPEYQYRNILNEFMTELQEKLDKDKDDIKNNIILARVFRAQGYNSRALTIVSKILEDNPGHIQAKKLKQELDKVQ